MCGGQNVFDVARHDHTTLQEQALVHSKELIKVYTCEELEYVQITEIMQNLWTALSNSKSFTT